jgi:manganese/zinc/iron transport system permease protein
MIAGDVWVIAGAASICALLIVLLFKEFLLVSFDAEFARVQGWPARRIDLGLMAFVAVTVVVSLPTVGVVLTAALLILPGAAARFWTDRLGRMASLAAAFGALMGVGGSALSATFEKLPAGPVITLVGTAMFLVSALFAPRRGWVARAIQQARDRWINDYDELLRKLLTRGGATALPELQADATWSKARARRLIAIAAAVKSQDVVKIDAERFKLTDQGGRRAAEAVRQHQLWHVLLDQNPDFASHARPFVETIEDFLPAPLVADLAAKLRNKPPRQDLSAEPAR